MLVTLNDFRKNFDYIVRAGVFDEPTINAILTEIKDFRRFVAGRRFEAGYNIQLERKELSGSVSATNAKIQEKI